MPKEYFLIRGPNWSNKYHIILPHQITAQNNSELEKSIYELNLSKRHEYTGWCIKKIEQGKIKPIDELKNIHKDEVCQDCISAAYNSNIPLPDVLKSF